MSFFEDASLVLIPSAQKLSKVYSVKPTDGTGDLTFSRASSATRVQSDGLIEKVRTNLLLQSQTFENASWAKVGVGTGLAAVVTANAGAAPDGTTTADRIVFDTGAGTTSSDRSIFRQSVVITEGSNLSFYIKSNTGSSQSIGFHNGGQIDIVTATTSWQRFSVNVTSAVTFFGLENRGDNATAGTCDVLVWGAQLQNGDIATDYIATTTAAVSVGPVSGLPRLDYLGSTCPRLLLEPQRTNLQIYSENSGLWQQPADGLTIAYNTTETLDPAGFNGAEKVTFSSGNGRMFEAVANAIGSVTMSAFVKAGTGNTIRLRTTSASIFVDFNLTTQAITPTFGTGTITNYGNGWYRVTATGTSATTPEVAQYVFPNSAGQFVYFWGAQFEDGAYATSYIPTLGTSVTRVADAASTASVPSLIGQTEGTMFIEFNRTNTFEAAFFMLSNLVGTTTNAYQNSFYFLQQANGTMVVEVYVASAPQVLFTVAALSVGTHKMALAYKANDFALYVDGVQLGTDTSGSVPTANFLSIGGAVDGGVQKQAVNQALLFKTRLTNTQLAELTA